MPDAELAPAPAPILAVVREPFAGFSVGDPITFPDALAMILSGPNARFVTVLAPQD